MLANSRVILRRLKGLVLKIYIQAGWKPDCDRHDHYIAIVEDAGPDYAVGVWFPDLPGCFSAGDDLDQAMNNTPEALALYIEEMDEVPRLRSLSELKADPSVANEMKNYMFAVIEVPSIAHAAE